MVVVQGRQELGESWGGEKFRSAGETALWDPQSGGPWTLCCGRASPFQPQLLSWPVPLEVSSPQALDLPGLATVGAWNCHLQVLRGSWLPGLVKS